MDTTFSPTIKKTHNIHANRVHRTQRIHIYLHLLTSLLSNNCSMLLATKIYLINIEFQANIPNGSATNDMNLIHIHLMNLTTHHTQYIQSRNAMPVGYTPSV